jgi:hypothetical protein
MPQASGSGTGSCPTLNAKSNEQVHYNLWPQAHYQSRSGLDSRSTSAKELLIEGLGNPYVKVFSDIVSGLLSHLLFTKISLVVI